MLVAGHGLGASDNFRLRPPTAHGNFPYSSPIRDRCPMDGEEFFDRLYSQFCLHFPCYALRCPGGKGFADEAASDETRAVVLLTDEDLVERFHRDRGLAKHLPVVVADAGSLARFLRKLPPAVTHVTF